MPSVVAIVCGFGVLLPAPATQQPMPNRQPAFVRVVDAEGRPLAGATVTFAGGLPHLAPAVPADVLAVTSDARGRATAKLRTDLCYCAFAVLPAAPDSQGQRGRRSKVHGYFAAGALLELPCVEAWSPTRVRISGAAAWAEHGPLQCMAWTEYPGRGELLEASATDEFVLGPAAAHAATLEVRDRHGRALWTAPVGQSTIALPPPQQVPVRVVDERGQPLAGVPIRQRVWRRPALRPGGFGGVAEPRWAELDVTGRDGRCTVVVAYPTDPLQQPAAPDLFLCAAPTDRPEVLGGILNRQLLRDDLRCKESKLTELVFTCAALEPLRGRCQVPAGTTAELHVVAALGTDARSYQHDPRWYSAAVGDDGRFAFSAPPKALHGGRLYLLPPGGGAWAFPFESGRLLPEAVAAEGAPWHRAQGLAAISIAVVEPDGGPARGGVLWELQEGRPQSLREAVMMTPLDAAGTARLERQPGRWLFAVVTQQGYGCLDVTLDGKASAESLRLAPFARMRLRIVDADGQPVAGAALSVAGTRTRGTGDPVEALWQSVAQGRRLRLPELASDAHGNLTIDFVPAPGLTVQLACRAGGRASPMFALEANEEPLVVTLGR